MLTSAKQSTPTGRLHLAAVAFALSACMGGSAPRARAFSPPPYGACRPIHSDRTAASTSSSGRLRAGDDASPSPSCDANDDVDAPPPTPPADMRLSDIRTELGGMNVSYADCFDRDSLEKRLAEARDGSCSYSTADGAEASSAGGSRSSRGAETAGSSSACPDDTDVDATETSKGSAVVSREFDRRSTLAEIRNLRVRELKVKLSEMKVRWGTMIEKEEMVKALCDAMEERFVRGENFSRTGILVPGVVKDVDEDALMMELGWSESDVSRGVASRGADEDVASPPALSRPPLLLDLGWSESDVSRGVASRGADEDVASPPALSRPPLLLDVYATWCGPCQFMAPLLAKAAEELGPDVRVVKLDSDKYPRISSVLKEIQRVEGALTKDQIIDFVNGNYKR
ncbi:hypothetical protein ACHAW5_002619 [Stephanodiscus triporus]|uniref:Thioredoxin domain-containing protein n=1 Tax=Stephanodiscus triporus TaxID=2934178 RepID=A0ABD3PWC7_9STRA